MKSKLNIVVVKHAEASLSKLKALETTLADTAVFCSVEAISPLAWQFEPNDKDAYRQTVQKNILDYVEKVRNQQKKVIVFYYKKYSDYNFFARYRFPDARISKLNLNMDEYDVGYVPRTLEQVEACVTALAKGQTYDIPANGKTLKQVNLVQVQKQYLFDFIAFYQKHHHADYSIIQADCPGYARARLNRNPLNILQFDDNHFYHLDDGDQLRSIDDIYREYNTDMINQAIKKSRKINPHAGKLYHTHDYMSHSLRRLESLTFSYLPNSGKIRIEYFGKCWRETDYSTFESFLQNPKHGDFAAAINSVIEASKSDKPENTGPYELNWPPLDPMKIHAVFVEKWDAFRILTPTEPRHEDKKSLLAEKIESHISALNWSRLNIFLESPSNKIDYLIKLKSMLIAPEYQYWSLDEILTSWDKHGSASAMLAKHRNVFFDSTEPVSITNSLRFFRDACRDCGVARPDADENNRSLYSELTVDLRKSAGSISN